jgi:hypothetical protein
MRHADRQDLSVMRYFYGLRFQINCKRNIMLAGYVDQDCHI